VVLKFSHSQLKNISDVRRSVTWSSSHHVLKPRSPNHIRTVFEAQRLLYVHVELNLQNLRFV